MRRPLVLAVLLTATLAAPLEAASIPGSADLSIGENRFDLIGRNEVDPTGLEQTLRARIQPGKTRAYTIRVANHDDVARTYELLGAPGGSRFGARYLDGDVDVTEAVVAGAHAVSLEPRSRVDLRLEVTAAAGVETGDAHTFDVVGTNADDPEAIADVVRLRVSVPPISVWAVNYPGTLRCTAEFHRRTLRPGFETGVRFTVTNLTDHTMDTVYAYGSLVFRDQQGTELWSTAGYLGPAPIVWRLKPGRTKELFSFDARVRWSGPLEIEPICGGLRLEMPRVSLPVAATTALPTEREAIDAAVVFAVPFQPCHPGPNGQPANATLETPDGRDLPPQTVRCWATVRREEGFDVVTLNLVAPSDAPDYTIPEATGGFPFGDELPGEMNMAASRWDLVVTTDRVRPFLSQMRARALGQGEGASYLWRRGEWQLSGWGPCGYEAFGLSGNGETFMLEWITGCSGPAAGPAREVVRLAR